MKRILIIMSLLVLGFASEGRADFSVKYDKYRLKNGLSVVLLPKKESSLVTVQLYYRVGGIDEESRFLGVSHFLEHMMFKTSKNLKAGEYSYTVKRNGGYDNAATSYDYTTYYNVLPADKLETGLRLEAERMANLRIDPKEFSKEKKVVIEERHNRYENSPMGFLWENANKTFFKNYVYGRPVIGFEETIRAINPSVMKDFYKKFYSPNNAVLIVAGSYNKKQAQKLIKQYFASLRKGRKIERRKESLLAKKAPKVFTGTKVFYKKVKTTYAMELTRIPDANHEMMPALLILDYILLNGKNSLFKKELVQKKRFCYSVGGGTYLRKLHSSFLFYFIPAPGVKSNVIVNEKKKLLKELLSRGDLNKLLVKAKAFLMTDFYKDLEQVKGLASTLGWGAMLESPSFLFDLYQKASRVDETKLKKAVRFLLKSQKGLFVLQPKK